MLRKNRMSYMGHRKWGKYGEGGLRAGRGALMGAGLYGGRLAGGWGGGGSRMWREVRRVRGEDELTHPVFV